MKRKHKSGGYLDELQTQQERDLQTYQPSKQEDMYVNLDDEDESESNEEQKQIVFSSQNQMNQLKKLPRFLEANQVNLDNAFKLKMPSDIHLVQCSSFLKSSIYLQSLATLYGIRVDSTLRDSFKVKCGILRIHGANTYEDNDYQPRDKVQRDTSALSKKKIEGYGLASLERNEKNLLVKSYDTVQINPFFHLTSKKLDLQKLSSMLLYRPQYANDISIIIDPEQLKPTTQLQERHQNVKIEFSFQPPEPFNYESYIKDNIIDIEENVAFADLTQFKNQIDDECRRKNISLSTRGQFKMLPTQKLRSDRDVKSSDIDQQTQQEWNQEIDHQYYDQQYSNQIDSNINDLQHIYHSSKDSKEKQIDTAPSLPLERNEMLPLMDVEQVYQDQEWNFVNQYIDENNEPNFDGNSVGRRQVDSFERNFEADYRNDYDAEIQDHQQQVESSSDDDDEAESEILDLLDLDMIKIIPAMTNVILSNQKNDTKIKDLLTDIDKNDPIFVLPPKLPRNQKKVSVNTLSWNFDDCLSYTRTILQIKRVNHKLNTNDHINKNTEQQQFTPNLDRYFEFSIRDIFNQFNSQENFKDDNDSIHDNQIIFNEYVEQDIEQDIEQEQQIDYIEQEQEQQLNYLEQVIQLKQIRLDDSQVQDIEDIKLLPNQIKDIQDDLQKDEETQIPIQIIKLPEQQLDRQRTKQEENQLQIQRPYLVNFKVILNLEKQTTQIPVKLLKQCVQKMIQILLEQNVTIYFSRIWLTLPLILPSAYKIITIGQLYIAILFLANEEKLILQRNVELQQKETDFKILRA